MKSNRGTECRDTGTAPEKKRDYGKIEEERGVTQGIHRPLLAKETADNRELAVSREPYAHRGSMEPVGHNFGDARIEIDDAHLRA